MTKSLDRLKRLAERKKIKGIVSFTPYTATPEFRYNLNAGHPDYEVPLGRNAQEARAALNRMGRSGDSSS